MDAALALGMHGRCVYYNIGMGPVLTPELEQLMLEADQHGIRLEIVRGIPSWEAQPGFRHQNSAFRIAESIVRVQNQGSDGGCVHALDLSIVFPDGSVKRPDLSIFCRVPDEQEGYIRLVPEAVVEIVSPGYEHKDYEVGPGLYLSQGVKDVVVHDPRSGYTSHFRREGSTSHVGPIEIALECGCRLTVPASP